MTSDLDIYRTASVLIRQYGEALSMLAPLEEGPVRWQRAPLSAIS